LIITPKTRASPIPTGKATDIPAIAIAVESNILAALKIIPHYDYPILYAHDATKGVECAKALMNDNLRDKYVKNVYADYEKVANLSITHKKPLDPISVARDNKPQFDFTSNQIIKPRNMGKKTITHTIDELMVQDIVNKRSTKNIDCLDYVPFV
jgi:cobalamin-dependent methionine synthase I